jgi:hypothetical protein
MQPEARCRCGALESDSEHDANRNGSHHGSRSQMGGTSSEKPWTWRWDKMTTGAVDLPLTSITRWRRGSFLTVYRFRTERGTMWWFYGPWNLAIGFGRG